VCTRLKNVFHHVGNITSKNHGRKKHGVRRERPSQEQIDLKKVRRCANKRRRMRRDPSSMFPTFEIQKEGA